MLDELIKSGDVVKVFLKRQDTGELLEHDIPWLLKGNVYKIISDMELEISTEKEEPEFQKNVCYVLYLFSFEKVFLCTSYYLNSYTEEGKRIISFELLSPLERVQRRMHQRVSNRAKLFLHHLEEEKVKEILKQQEMSFAFPEESLEPVYSVETMIDISAGGIRMTAKEPIRMGEYLYMKFDIQDEENPLTINTCSQVIYSEQFRNERGVYDIRLKFIGMPEGTKEKIIHFVFQVEREKRRTGGRVS